MASEIMNATANALVWISSTFDAPTRAVVFGVPIDGNSLLSFYPLVKKLYVVKRSYRRKLKQPLGSWHYLFLWSWIIMGMSLNYLLICPCVGYEGHLVVEVLLVVVILFQLTRKSYKPPKKPLSEKVGFTCFFVVFFTIICYFVMKVKKWHFRENNTGNRWALWWLGAWALNSAN